MRGSPVTAYICDHVAGFPNTPAVEAVVGGSRCSGPVRLRRMLLRMSDLDCSKIDQFSHQILEICRSVASRINVVLSVA